MTAETLTNPEAITPPSNIKELTKLLKAAERRRESGGDIAQEIAALATVFAEGSDAVEMNDVQHLSLSGRFEALKEYDEDDDGDKLNAEEAAAARLAATEEAIAPITQEDTSNWRKLEAEVDEEVISIAGTADPKKVAQRARKLELDGLKGVLDRPTTLYYSAMLVELYDMFAQVGQIRKAYENHPQKEAFEKGELEDSEVKEQLAQTYEDIDNQRSLLIASYEQAIKGAKDVPKIAKDKAAKLVFEDIASNRDKMEAEREERRETQLGEFEDGRLALKAGKESSFRAIRSLLIEEELAKSTTVELTGNRAAAILLADRIGLMRHLIVAGEKGKWKAEDIEAGRRNAEVEINKAISELAESDEEAKQNLEAAVTELLMTRNRRMYDSVIDGMLRSRLKAEAAKTEAVEKEASESGTETEQPPAEEESEEVESTQEEATQAEEEPTEAEPEAEPEVTEEAPGEEMPAASPEAAEVTKADPATQMGAIEKAAVSGDIDANTAEANQQAERTLEEEIEALRAELERETAAKERETAAKEREAAAKEREKSQAIDAEAELTAALERNEAAVDRISELRRTIEGIQASWEDVIAMMDSEPGITVEQASELFKALSADFVAVNEQLNSITEAGDE